MNPPLSAKEKLPAARREPAPARRDGAPSGQAQTDLRVRYYRRMNVQRVYPLTVEVPALRAGQTPPPVVESVVVRPVIPGALVVPVEQKLDPNRPGASVRFHVTPLALGWLPDSRVEVHHPGRPVQEIPLGSRPMSMVLWVILLVLLFPIVVPLRLLLGPWGGPPRAVTQRSTWLLLLLAVVIPVLLLVVTRYAPMSGTIIRPVIDFPGEGKPAPLGPAMPGGGGGPAPMRPMPMLGVAPGAGLLDGEEQDEKKDEKKEEKKPEEPAKKEEPKAAEGAGAQGEVPAPPNPGDLNGPRLRQAVQDYSDQPGVLLTDRLETLFREQVPPVPVLADTVFPAVAQGVGTVYGLLCDKPNQREFHPSFWTFVVLLLFTGLSWVTHSGYRAVTRKAIDLTPRTTDAEAIETLPLSPNDRPAGLPE